MLVQPYLFFEGRAAEALEFYRNGLGAEVVMMMRFKDAPESAGCPVKPENADKVMHAEMKVGGSTILLSDGRCESEAKFQGFSLSVVVTDESEARKIFAALGDGGQVGMPLDKTFFSPLFGMVTDRFGVMWMVYVMGQK